MAEIAFRGVSKTYDPGLFKKKVRAVTDVSFEIVPGEVFGLIGPNGAGKSTTIRLLLGLIRPDTGNLEFRGKPLAQAAIQSHIGYLPENPYLYDHLTLQELLAFSGQASGLMSPATNRRTDELLEKLNLTAAKKRALRTFSKGMLQRAGICFALLHDPSVVILDEPMSGLDPIGRKMVFDLVTELKGQGKTIFFCSHILSDVERLCDRIGMMVSGRLVKVYEKKDLLPAEGRVIHLVVSQLSPPQQHALSALVTVTPGHVGGVLTFPPQRLEQVSETLRELGIEVLASRAENVSLEELFMDVAKEQER